MMKTISQVFVTGVKEITTTPALFGDVLEYEGKFYKVGTVRQEVKDTKVEDDSFYLLTLAAVAGKRRLTSELPSHLMNHEVKKGVTNVYHAHTTNVIALTFVLTLEDKVFTRELWEMATECPVVFPSGIGVVGWMVPGGREIAVATSALMKEYDVAIWAHHGMFCSGEDFDLTFGLMHTVEKSAEILVKMLSMRPDKRQTISPQNFRDLAKDFKVTLPEKFLYDK